MPAEYGCHKKREGKEVAIAGAVQHTMKVKVSPGCIGCFVRGVVCIVCVAVATPLLFETRRSSTSSGILRLLTFWTVTCKIRKVSTKITGKRHMISSHLQIKNCQLIHSYRNGKISVGWANIAAASMELQLRCCILIRMPKPDTD